MYNERSESTKNSKQHDKFRDGKRGSKIMKISKNNPHTLGES
jgi:hypothetical protein